MATIEELQALAERAWPNATAIVVESDDRCIYVDHVDPSDVTDGKPLVLDCWAMIEHPRAAQALEAALRVLAGEPFEDFE